MKTVARIVSAAFALAIIAVPFAQPASAAAPADLHVKGESWDYQGIPWGGRGSPPDPNAKVHVIFSIHNYGGSSSGDIKVWRSCHYPGGKKVTFMSASGGLTYIVLPPVSSGKGTLVWFDCKRLNGALPTGASVHAFGVNEPVEKRDGYNTAELVFTGLVG
ncbi:MAG TPA: hypothetical protein VFH48_45655 [Chloroflexota bacterium]|nr:hypothetical protein [Chloroflexota bacterium]